MLSASSQSRKIMPLINSKYFKFKAVKIVQNVQKVWKAIWDNYTYDITVNTVFDHQINQVTIKQEVQWGLSEVFFFKVLKKSYDITECGEFKMNFFVAQKCTTVLLRL